MKSPLVCQFAERLMRHPAAPYYEHAVRAEAEQICAEHGLACEQDSFGNLLARLRTAPRLRPLVLAAHLDHPGFEILRPLPNGRLLARFRGGVSNDYFQPGLPLRLMPGAVPARLGACQSLQPDKLFQVEVSPALRTSPMPRPAPPGRAGCPQPAAAGSKHPSLPMNLPPAGSPLTPALSPSDGERGPGGRVREFRGSRREGSFRRMLTAHEDANPYQFAVWDLPDFTLRNDHIHGRACDDLIGVASALATLVELKRRRACVHVLAVMSRAEEVGLHGAITLAATRGLPANSLVLSLETSRELPGAAMGGGVVLRMGDRMSVFDSEASRYLVEIANQLKAKRPAFTFQRALMTGGTCEATAYQEFGLQSAAVCVPLGNYHNCGPRARIQAEYVNVSDVCRMVELLTAAANSMPRYTQVVGQLPRTLRQRFREARPWLRRSARHPVQAPHAAARSAP